MHSNKSFTWLAALLGVVLGVVACLFAISLSEHHAGKRVKYADWQKLNFILRSIQDKYVDSVDVVRLTDAAVRAALAELDPHSIYIPASELEATEGDLKGNFEGIGIQFNVPNDTAIVLEVIAGGPSEKAGLMPGDRIMKVDGTVIAGVRFPQDSIVRRIKGPSGSRVLLEIMREGELTSFEIVRGKIPLYSVDAAFMVNDTTGYIKLSKFSRTTFEEVSSATAGLLEDGMKRLIFDVRNNSGGYLDQALLLSDLFLRKGDMIVYIEGLNQPREVYRADGRGSLQELGLTVLVDENSASSSEIFAGAVQDNDRGVIVGRRTFGKGLVQEPVYFTDGSAVRITIARFHTPSGRCIQKPYASREDYDYDIFRRYTGGELFVQDSVKVDSSEVYKTVGGRTVFGGGGIVPDIFVPLDTVRANNFVLACNRKGTQMRFASHVFDRNRDRLLAAESFAELEKLLDGLDLPSAFLRYAASVDKLVPQAGEWEACSSYVVPQIRALVGRYSKLGENAFYRLYLPVDSAVEAALRNPSIP